MRRDQSPKERIAAARTFLFVPGDRPERFDKAAASGADIVILDLEDAVAPAAKAEARAAVRAWLESGKTALVRINAEGTDWFEQDLELASLPSLLGVMLPKSEAGPALARVAALTPVIALIESAGGVADVRTIATLPGVERLAFGTIDLALDLQTTADDVLTAIGIQLVVASRASGIAAPIDGVTVVFKDPAPVEQAMRLAKTRGFTAKLCIHPAQLPAVRQAFMPTDDELAHAKRVVEADRASGGSAVALDGKMIDRPVVAKAYRVLGDAGIS